MFTHKAAGEGMSISLSRLIVVITALFLILTVTLIFITSSHIKQKAIGDLARDDARQTSELVFQSLFTAMRKGWTKDEIMEIVERLNQIEPEMNIRVFRGQPVIRQYGDIDGEQAVRESDPLIMQALESGEESMTILDSDHVRYIYPVKVRAECMDCHRANPGDVNGVIDILYPIRNLKVSLDFILNMVVIYFSVVMLLLAISLHSTLRSLIVSPIRSITGVIHGMVAHLDLSQRISSASRITEIRSLIIYFNKLLATMQNYSSKLEQLSTHDPLTGLYNRLKFNEFIEHEVDRHYRHRHPFSVLMIDMDNFKHINDTFGHPIGDLVIKKFGKLISHHLRRSDVIARFGGDEFGVLLPETGTEEAMEVAEKLCAYIADQEIRMPVGRVRISASIGLITFPDTVTQRDKIDGAMDIAMYKAKKHGRNRVMTIDSNEMDANSEVFARGQQVRKALEEDRVEAHLQPIVDVASGKVFAYEVLARIRDGNAVVNAADFIHHAEELGMAERLDERVFEKAMQVRKARGIDGTPLFINLSSMSFGNIERMRAFPRRLVNLGVPASDIVFEITEREALPHLSELTTLINELREEGIRFALDDFGSGFSSFMYLKYLEVDFVKIEGDFVRHAPQDIRDRVMVEHIHIMSQKFGIQTIAEYVEDEEIHLMLQELGVNFGQGYYYGKPTG